MKTEEIIFLFDPPTEGWLRRNDEAFADEIERLTPIVVMKRPEGETVWCGEHQSCEKVASWHDDGLTTEAGCRMRGPMCEVPCLSDAWQLPEAIPRCLRWRVSYRSDSGTVFIAADVAHIVLHSRPSSRGRYSFIPHVQRYTAEGLSLRLSPMAEIPEKNCAQIPSIVADAALDLLLDDAERRFGSRPKLPQGLYEDLLADGRTRLTAFLRWPFHMELLYMLPYFHGTDKDFACWGHDADDVFPKLCHLLGVTPSARLREAYRRRALSLPIAVFLRRHGVNRFDLAEPFFRFNSLFGEPLICERGKNYLSIGGYLHRAEHEYPEACFTDDEAARRVLKGREGSHWGFEASIFYCRWRLHHEGEEALARHLLDLHDHWEPRFKSAVHTFYRYYTELPKGLRDHILRHGFTVKAQNRMIAVANRNKLGPLPAFTDPAESAAFTYPPEAKGYECRIGGFSFRLMRSCGQMKSFMQKRNCWSSLDEAFYKDDGALRFGLYREDRPAAMIVLHGTIRILYAGMGNEYEQALADAKAYIACLRWLKWTGLYRRYEPFDEEDYAVLNEVDYSDVDREDYAYRDMEGCAYLDEEVRPVPLDDTKTEQTPHELLTLPEAEICEGYYTRLHEMFLREKPLLFVVPPEETGTDEMEYLMRLFPYGERIYQAAFAGNREAQLVLAKCYDDGCSCTLFADSDAERKNIGNLLCGLPPDTDTFREERGKYWRQKAANVKTEG